MNTTRLIASIVGSLAWPGAAVAAVWILRRPLSELLGALRSARGLGVQLDFERALTRARALTDESGPALLPAGKQVAPVGELAQLAASSPHAVVEEAWQHLQARVREHAPSKGREATLDAGSLEAYEILRSLHREATLRPGVEVSATEALEFARLAERLAASIGSGGTPARLAA